MKLLIGATGMLGSEICRLMRNDPAGVTALIRPESNPEKVAFLKSLGVKLIEGDIKNINSILPAFEGVKTVISTVSSMPFSYIPGENDIEHVDEKGMKNVINCAKNAGVDHFIYTSFSGQIDLDFPLRNAKRSVEEHLVKSGMQYTILRPSYFMEVWLSPAVGFDVEHAKVQVYGSGKNPVSYISFKDLAKIAAASLDMPTAKNSILEIGGPQNLSQLDAVHVFEEITNRKFEVQYVPKEALSLQLKEVEDPMQKSFTGLMLCLANGDPIDMDEFSRAWSIKLTSLREFAEGMMVEA